MFCLQVSILLLVGRVVSAQQACTQDLLDRSFVTQCNPSLCEAVLETDADGNRPNEWPKTPDEVVHIVSNRAGDRLKVNTYKATNHVEHYYQESHINGTMFVDTKVLYQRVLGFGTTLTDSSCTNIDNLPSDIRDKLISDYFSVENGIGLNLIKVPIGSTKYSFTNYVLDMPDNQYAELSSYDTDSRIPIIKDAMSAAGKLKNRVKILASSLTAPHAYKDNNLIIRGGSIRANKITDYASYLTSFVAAYKVHNLSIWSLILSEHPVTNAKIESNNSEELEYNSMVLKPSQTVSLVKAIKEERSKRNDIENFRLLMLGDNRAFIPVWADSVFRSKEANESVAGVAYICDNKDLAPYDNLVYVTKRYSNKYLLAIQGSSNSPVKLGNWQYAENYASEIIKNLDFGSVGWIDFNAALNLEGGPALSNRYKADASVMVEPKKGAFYRNPMFYAIAHFSRYVKPGSIRAKSILYSSPHMYAAHQIGFITPDNYLVVVVLNNNIGPMPLSVGINTRTRVEVLLETKSFNTFIFRL